MHKKVGRSDWHCNWLPKAKIKSVLRKKEITDMLENQVIYTNSFAISNENKHQLQIQKIHQHQAPHTNLYYFNNHQQQQHQEQQQQPKPTCSLTLSMASQLYNRVDKAGVGEITDDGDFSSWDEDSNSSEPRTLQSHDLPTKPKNEL